MPRSDSQRQRPVVGASRFDLHAKCRKHSSELDCQYFAANFPDFTCCVICALWTVDQWISFRRTSRLYALWKMSSHKATDKSVKKDVVSKKPNTSKSKVNSSGTTVPTSVIPPITQASQVVVSQPEPLAAQTTLSEHLSGQSVPSTSQSLLVGLCGLGTLLDFSRPDMLFNMLQTLFVAVTGSRADELTCLGHVPTREAIKGPAVGSGSPNHRLTEVVSSLPDESIFRSVCASPLVGGMTDMQNDLAYSAPPIVNRATWGSI
jgi:hypothetical protein